MTLKEKIKAISDFMDEIDFDHEAQLIWAKQIIKCSEQDQQETVN